MRSESPITRLDRLCVTYPSGNTTAVVFDDLLGDNRKMLNSQLMQAWKQRYPNEPEIEQCCFVTAPHQTGSIARVELFGGEFCGNAARSAAWLLTGGKDGAGLIEVSGVERPLRFKIVDGVVSLEMPLPVGGQLARYVADGTLVQLDGIAQLVIDRDMRERQTPRSLLTRILADNMPGLASQAAVGVSYYDQESRKAEFCVWVNEVDTIFDETACGSGTCAIGVALALSRKRSVSLPVIQPSGENILSTALYKSGDVTASSIAGQVRILYDGGF